MKDIEASRNENLFMAKIAEQAKSYEKMVNFMEKVVSRPLTVQERNLLADEAQTDINLICDGILNLLNSLVGTSTSTDPKSKAFYLKLKGDCYKYQTEFKTGDDEKEAVGNALDAYNSAKAIIISAKLDPKNPDRAEDKGWNVNALWLGLALSLSEFHYEILGSHENAIGLAAEALFDTLGTDDENCNQITNFLDHVIHSWQNKDDEEEERYDRDWTEK